MPAARPGPEAASAPPHTSPESAAWPRLRGHHTHPLGDGAAAGALPLLPGVDDLLDPDGFPLLSIPAEGVEAPQLRETPSEEVSWGAGLRTVSAGTTEKRERVYMSTLC